MNKLVTNFFQKPKSYQMLIFFAFLFLYVLLGMCITYPTSYGANIFFGADNSRACGDILNFNASHYRIKVHPLFLLMVQPIAKLLQKFCLGHTTLTVLVLQGFCGALSNSMLYSTLENLKIEKNLRFLLTLIHGLSFSSLIFSTVPETFIYAELILVGYWYYLSSIMNNKEGISWREIVILVFFGITSFGVTLTNYACYTIGLIYLLLKRENGKGMGIKKYIGINVVNGLCIIVLCLIQKVVWKDAPLFWSNILDSLFYGVDYEETRYMNWSINFSKTIQWIKQTVCYPLLSPNTHLTPEGQKYRSIYFGGYNTIIQLAISLFIITALLLIFWYLIQLLRKRNKEGFFLAVFLAWGTNMCLHYVYGAGEAFMYSPHYYFLLILLVGCACNRLENKMVRKSIQIFLFIFVIMEAINNLIRFLDTANLGMEYAGTSYSVSKAIIVAVIATVAAIVLTICEYIFRTKFIFHAIPVTVSTTAIYWICIYTVLVILLSGYLGFAY